MPLNRHQLPSDGGSDCVTHHACRAFFFLLSLFPLLPYLCHDKDKNAIYRPALAMLNNSGGVQLLLRPRNSGFHLSVTFKTPSPPSASITINAGEPHEGGAWGGRETERDASGRPEGGSRGREAGRRVSPPPEWLVLLPFYKRASP